MKLSTRGRYATRIMVAIGLRSDRPSVHVQEIADSEGLARDYVVQILTHLRAAGLVESRRGKSGGYLLTRPTSTITVLDVLHATEGDLAIVPCLREPCDRASDCVTQALWKKAGSAMAAVLEAYTIADLVETARARLEANAPAYDI